jgi:hypothetical protein
LKRLLVFLAMALPLALPCPAQIFTNLQNDTSRIKFCVGPTCAGGQTTPTSYGVVDTVAPDGTPSMEFMESGGAYANSLAYSSNGATSANYFMHDVWFYVEANTLDVAQALEFDNYVYTAPYRWIFGSQCVIGGDWDGWNDFTSHWVETKIPCKLNVGWNHLTEWSHRSQSPSSACRNMPCSYQDTWEINGTAYPINIVTPASNLPKGWANESGAQIQLDTNAKGGTVVVWYKDWNFTELGH